MNIQLSLLESAELEKIEEGSGEWRKIKYNEYKDKDFNELLKLSYDLMGVKNSYSYYLCAVIIDILHYDRIDEFKKRYPCAVVYKTKPFYL